MSGLFPFRGSRQTPLPPQRFSIPNGHNPRRDPRAPTGPGVLPGFPGSAARADPNPYGAQGSRRINEPQINAALTICTRNPRNPQVPINAQFAPRTPAFIGNKFVVEKAFANESGVHQLLCWPALNYHLRSAWGRQEYGTKNTPELLLQDWNSFGFQLADEKINNDESRGTTSKSFCLQGPTECPNGWFAAGRQIYVGDTLLLLLVRLPYNAADLPESHTNQIGLDASLTSHEAHVTAVVGPEYMWQLIPHVLHQGEILDPALYGNPYSPDSDRFIGSYFVMGTVRALDATEDFAGDVVRAKQLVFPNEFSIDTIDKYLKLPQVKIDIGAGLTT